MATLREIDSLAKEYADDRQRLNDRLTGLEDELELVKRKHMPSIINAVNKAKKSRETLSIAVDNSRDLFVKPKTQTAHGIKFGLQTSPDSYTFEDEAQVIKKIKKLMMNNADSLINTRESVSKTALKQLTPSELGKIGVEVVPGCESVIVKDTNSEIDKFVNKLLEKDGKLDA